MKLHAILLLLFCPYWLAAQVQLSTPLEILTFMEASPTSYELEELQGEIPRKNNQVIPHGTYIVHKDTKEYQLEYKNGETKQQTKWRTQARKLISYENPNYKKARKLYHKILKQSPQNAQMYTFIGETYYETKDYPQAYQWFQKAIKINPIDYLARWLMAEIHLHNQNLDSAMQYITMAHIYNRNHIRLGMRLHEIYQEKQQSYFRDWEFEPRYRLYKDSNRVVVSADGIWLTYGMYKAVWKYEPDYVYIKQQQEVTDYLFQEEMEAVIGTFMTYNTLRKDDRKIYPAMEAFGLCLDYQMVEEYVLYEILLPNYPTVSYHITTEFMQRLTQYIYKVRGQKHTP